MTKANRTSLRIASWNLHRCIGNDRIKSVERCIEVLQEINADMIALQEVESNPGHEFDTLAMLAKATKSNAIPGTTMKLEDSDYGNAILSRLQPRQPRHHNLNVPGREPRMALDLSFNIEPIRLQLVATHLGLRPSERREQVHRLLKVFDFEQHDIVVLAGDFNEWLSWGRPLRALHRMFPETPHTRSWPTRSPFFALDRIWVWPRPVLYELATHRSPLSRQASDHLPLVADLQWSNTNLHS